MAIRACDRGGGVAVKHVAKMLRVDPSLVTSQSKGLERIGLLHRGASSKDGRITLMSLTPKAFRDLTELRAAHPSVESSILKSIDQEQVERLNMDLSTLLDVVDKAAKRLAAEV
jgi:DNA-binding MarR family transcriptional regulator